MFLTFTIQRTLFKNRVGGTMVSVWKFNQHHFEGMLGGIRLLTPNDIRSGARFLKLSITGNDGGATQFRVMDIEGVQLKPCDESYTESDFQAAVGQGSIPVTDSSNFVAVANLLVPQTSETITWVYVVTRK
ncbi:hypothetical protein ACFL0L_04510 [Patescibacteria group bacterium]